MKGIALIILSIFVLSTAEASGPMPPGWEKGGREPVSYEVGIDATHFHTNPNSYYIKSIKEDVRNLVNGVFFQLIDATAYKGKRIRITASVKTEHPDKSGNTSYFYVSDHGAHEIYKWVDREKDWHQVSLIFDVADTTTKFEYGISLWGKGQLWADDVNLAIVDNSVLLDPGS